MCIKPYLLLSLLFTLVPFQAAKAYDAAQLQRLLATGACVGCDLRGVDLSGLSLDNIRLSWSDLTDSNLRGVSMRGVNLVGADLHNADLTNADLRGSVLKKANLTGVDLSEVHLIGSDLRGAILSHMDVDMDLEWMDLTGVLLEGAQFRDGVRCSGFSAKGGWGCSAEVAETQ